MVGGTWASARVKPRVAARVVISGGASGSAPAAWQREVAVVNLEPRVLQSKPGKGIYGVFSKQPVFSRVFYATHDGSMGRFCMFTYPQASSNILS